MAALYGSHACIHLIFSSLLFCHVRNGCDLVAAKIDNANSSLGLPQDPNNLLFGESATILFCAPKSGALTFQKHAFFVCGGHAVG